MDNIFPVICCALSFYIKGATEEEAQEEGGWLKLERTLYGAVFERILRRGIRVDEEIGNRDVLKRRVIYKMYKQLETREGKLEEVTTSPETTSPNTISQRW